MLCFPSQWSHVLSAASSQREIPRQFDTRADPCQTGVPPTDRAFCLALNWLPDLICVWVGDQTEGEFCPIKVSLYLALCFGHGWFCSFESKHFSLFAFKRVGHVLIPGSVVCLSKGQGQERIRDSHMAPHCFLHYKGKFTTPFWTSVHCGDSFMAYLPHGIQEVWI